MMTNKIVICLWMTVTMVITGNFLEFEFGFAQHHQHQQPSETLRRRQRRRQKHQQEHQQEQARYRRALEEKIDHHDQKNHYDNDHQRRATTGTTTRTGTSIGTDKKKRKKQLGRRASSSWFSSLPIFEIEIDVEDEDKKDHSLLLSLFYETNGFEYVEPK